MALAVSEFRRAASPLRVTAPPTFGARWLAPRLPTFPAAGSAAIELDISSDVRDVADFDVAVRTGRGGWDGLDEYALRPVDVTPMISPTLLASSSLAQPEDLVKFDLLPHPDWSKWFARAETEMPRSLRFASVDYSIFELIANAAVAGTGVALLSPTLFQPLLQSRQLVAPFPTILKGPDWYFALVKESDHRPATRDFCRWLQEQSGELAHCPSVSSQ